MPESQLKKHSTSTKMIERKKIDNWNIDFEQKAIENF